jgi:hypothetical protein
VEPDNTGGGAVCDAEERPTPRPLPAPLEPTPEECAAHQAQYQDYLPTTRLPRAGDTVVIDLGHVMWLVILDEARPVTQDNSLIMSAGRLDADHGHAVDWEKAAPVDPDDVNLEDEDAAALPRVRDLLIDRANTGP